MLHFERSVLIDAPVEVVWQFHERPDILQILTPPRQPVRVVRRQGGLAVGAVSEFLIFLGPLPIRWVAVHVEYEKYRLFSDRQQQGLVDYWLHRHHFTEENGKTRLTDAIDFSLPYGWLTEPLLGWWVLDRLEHMFRYRHEVTQREIEKI